MLNFNLYLIFIFLTIIGVFLSIWGLLLIQNGRQKDASTKSLILTLVSIIFYLVINFFTSTTQNQELLLNGYKLSSMLITIVIYSWFFFSLSIYNAEIQRKYPFLQFVWIIPIFFLTIHFGIPQYFSVTWGIPNIRFDPPFFAFIEIQSRSPLFWLNWIQSYSFLAITVFFLIAANLRKGPRTIPTTWWTVGVSAIPILSNLLYTFQWMPGTSSSLMGIALIMSTALIVIHIYQTRLDDLVPSARAEVIDTMPVGMITIDQNNRVVDINPFALRLADPDKIGGEVTLNVIELFQNWQAFLEAIQAVGSPEDLMVEHPSGRSFTLRVQQLRKNPWQPAARLIIIEEVTDITRSKALIAESEKQYRLLADNAADIIWKLRLGDHTFSFLSPSVERIFGYSLQMAATMRLDQILTPESYHKAIALIGSISARKQEIESGEPLFLVEEFNAIAKSGVIIPIETVAHAILEEDGLIAIIGHARDITDRREQEDMILKQQNMIAASQERVKLGHDLHDGIGQLLAFIHTQSQLIADRPNPVDPQKDKDDLAKITSAADQAIQQVRVAMNTLINVDDEQNQKAADSLPEAIEILVDEIAFRYNTKIRLNISHNIPRKTIPKTNIDKLILIIREALVNAQKHASAEQVSLFIQKIENFIVVTIIDDGAGFDADELQKKTAAEGHFGLRIMRERAEQLHANVEVSSQPGKGTQVTITIPLESKTEVDLDHLKELRYMIVDDHPIFRDGMLNLLTSFKLNVIGMAENGDQAIKIFKDLRPEVVFLDLNMKPIDGFEVLRMIKSIDPSTIVIILTVSDDESTMMDVIKAGADGYLLKNLDIQKLMPTISKIINGQLQVSPEIQDRIVQKFSKKARRMEDLIDEHGLTPQQVGVLKLVHAGMTYERIAESLNLSVPTIKYHIKQINYRLGLQNKAEIMRFITDYLAGI